MATHPARNRLQLLNRSIAFEVAENAERALQLLAVMESGADTVDLQKHRQGQDGKRAIPGA